MAATLPSASMTLTWVVPPLLWGRARVSAWCASISARVSATACRWSAEPNSPRRRRSSRSSASATSAPPNEGGGLLSTRTPRNVVRWGARSITR